jgi:hypothetical protein
LDWLRGDLAFLTRGEEIARHIECALKTVKMPGEFDNVLHRIG